MPSPRAPRVVEEFARRLKTLPGAHAATVTDLVRSTTRAARTPRPPSKDASSTKAEPEIHYVGVAGRWPETFDVRVEGRTFFEHELEQRAPVALVNQTLARAFWPDRILGRRFRLAEEDNSPWLTVIGVVPDIRTVKLMRVWRRRRRHTCRIDPSRARLRHRHSTQAAPESVVPDLRAAVRAIDPSLALYDALHGQVRWLSYWMPPRGARCSVCSRSLRSSSPRSACLASSTTPSRNARKRSAFAWHLAQAVGRWSVRC